MSSMPWCRLYSEFSSDPKVQMMSEAMQRRYLMLLCLASAGTVPVRDDAVVSFALRISLDDCAVTKQLLVARGLIADDWMPLKWEFRQFKSDHDSAERKRRQRERDQSQPDVTTESRDSHDPNRTEQSRAEQTPAAPPGLDAAAWEKWLGYRREIRQPLKPASIPAAQRKLAAFGGDQSAVVEQSMAQGWTGLFAIKAAGRPRNVGADGGLKVVT